MHPSTVPSTHLHHTRNIYRQMAGCADGKELQISDSQYTWKFQPPESRHAATPSPLSTKSKCPSASLPPPYFWTCFQQTASKHINSESAATTAPQQCKREPDNWVSSRWNPTPEQLHSLEELYRSGTRTPTAKQIQQIAARLGRFGKIEGKNVFYWFQNHKSRERLKHHRRINLGLKKRRSVQKQSELTRTDFIVGQGNYWASLSNGATSSEESASRRRALIAEGNTSIAIKSEKRERELRQSSRSDSRKLAVDNIWQKIEMSPATTCTTAPETLLEVARSQKFSTETQLCNIRLKPKHDNVFNQDLLGDERRRRESHTLQLFPSPSLQQCQYVAKDEAESPILTVNTNLTPIEFYELFPLNLKN